MTLNEDNVADYADTLALQVRGSGVDVGHELDYSEASIDTIEALLRVSDELFRLPAFPDNQRNLVVFYNGCYLGEVISRKLGGTWRFADNWFESSLVIPYGSEGGLQVFPFQKVYRRVTEGPDENDLVAYYEGMKRKLAEPSPPDED